MIEPTNTRVENSHEREDDPRELLEFGLAISMEMMAAGMYKLQEHLDRATTWGPAIVADVYSAMLERSDFAINKGFYPGPMEKFPEPYTPKDWEIHFPDAS